MKNWAKDIFCALKRANVLQIAYVPDAGHKWLISACESDSAIVSIPVTTEEEGVAVLAGAWLGGQRGAMLMQSSGVGNCINMFSLITECKFPFACFVTMRGQWNEFNPWQRPMGKNAGKLLKTMGFSVNTVSHATKVGAKSEEMLHQAFTSDTAAALLLHQRLTPRKTFGE
ncbi:MAG: hypothetical protein CFH06_01569 [Alphaproteobacteria bacterium MarineAlpha3_Bin5]|nr:phosphonopyruvate decarboxylase [Magnetovibrio sp.]PPR76905.1 MAG: hypothetical protein CFH06_01569 [Alphaproteobacteria bacterium MarineAlpha3_Bin5]|tara:strand:- start:233 stop:745 length:513 start_codon:yes stop_codon:yes gene_type:complete